MTRRRWRRMELARPARDAVVVRESTVVVRFPFSRAGSRVGRPARHLLRSSRPVLGRSGADPKLADGSGLSGRSTVGPRCGMTTGILRPNTHSVKWPLMPAGVGSSPSLVRRTSQRANDPGLDRRLAHRASQTANEPGLIRQAARWMHRAVDDALSVGWLARWTSQVRPSAREHGGDASLDAPETS
jgi:hypothetical protein